jgi:hypothetical protein
LITRRWTLQGTQLLYFFLFCTMTNKCTIISQINTLLHISKLSCHPQGPCNQYLAKLHKYFEWSCWYCITNSCTWNTCVLYHQQLHLKYLCNLARHWLQAPWGWHYSIEKCRTVIICEIVVQFVGHSTK